MTNSNHKVIMSTQSMKYLYDNTKDTLTMNRDVLIEGPDNNGLTEEEWLQSVNEHNKACAVLQETQDITGHDTTFNVDDLVIKTHITG